MQWDGMPTQTPLPLLVSKTQDKLLNKFCFFYN